MRASIALAALLAAIVGCKDRDVSDHSAFEEETEEPERESDIVKIETTVKPGVQVPCEAVLGAEEVAALLEEEVTIEDRSETQPDVTSVCAIHRAGTPPSTAVQERRSEKTGRLGVLPGDEICTVEARCAAPSSAESIVSTCEQRGDTINEDLGYPACVHTTQRGTRWAYTYRVYDSDSGCVYRVLGGPSVTEGEIVQRCTDVAMTVIDKSSFANPE